MFLLCNYFVDNSKVAIWVKSWLDIHPGWQHWFWTESSARQLIGKKYNQFLDIYDQYPYKINRADVRRYFIMYEHGGVYADLDVESLRNLDHILHNYPCIIAQEPLEHQVLLYPNNTSNFAMPAFMACRPKHPFFKLLIDKLSQFITLAWTLPWNDNILQSTGPQYVNYILTLYQTKHNNTGQDYIHIAPSEWFMPTYDNTNRNAINALCSNISALSKIQAAACRKDTSNIAGNKAFTDHHWLHTWNNHFKTGTNVHVHDINPSIHLVI